MVNLRKDCEIVRETVLGRILHKLMRFKAHAADGSTLQGVVMMMKMRARESGVQVNMSRDAISQNSPSHSPSLQHKIQQGSSVLSSFDL